MTYRELIHMVNDELKMESDDAYFTLDHIRFLCNKYRAMLIKQEALSKKLWNKVLPESPMYQSICVGVKEASPTCEGDICGGKVLLKSDVKIPSTISEVGDPQVSGVDYFGSVMIVYTTRNRMRFTGNNKWLKNFIYASVGADGHLYLSSNNPQFRYLEKVMFTGVFEDAEKATKLQNECECKNSGESQCKDIMDSEYPIEGYMVPTLIKYVVQELVSAEYRPKDTENNALDDLSTIAQYIRNNMKSNFQKQMDGV